MLARVVPCVVIDAVATVIVAAAGLDVVAVTGVVVGVHGHAVVAGRPDAEDLGWRLLLLRLTVLGLSLIPL